MNETKESILFFGEGFPKIIGSEFSEIDLRKNETGGVDVFVDGIQIVHVLNIDIKDNHPFPSITLEIGMKKLSWDSPDIPDLLQYRNDDRNDSCDREEDIKRELPGDRFPAKIKRFFCKR